MAAPSKGTEPQRIADLEFELSVEAAEADGYKRECSALRAKLEAAEARAEQMQNESRVFEEQAIENWRMVQTRDALLDAAHAREKKLAGMLMHRLDYPHEYDPDNCGKCDPEVYEMAKAIAEHPEEKR